MEQSMNLLNSVLLLLALQVAAQVQIAEHPLSPEVEKFSSKLETLIAGHQYAPAETLVRQRLENGGDPAMTYFQAGKTYFNHEAWQRSAGFLEKSLQLQPMNDAAHQLLGLAYRQLHRPDDAEAELLESAKENPSNRENVYLAGHQLLLNGKVEAALPYLYQALDAKVLRSQALQALAFAQARLGNYGLAESYYRKVIDFPQTSDGGRYSALVNLDILLLLGHEPARLEEGLSCAQRAEKLRPDSPDARFLAGKALFKLGRLREARAELAQAAKLNPEDSKPHFLLARIYDEIGQHDRARVERENFARLQHQRGQAGMATAQPVLVAPE